MDPREQRGLAIAALCRLDRAGDSWTVPSQSCSLRYTVNPAQQTCTCPDHVEGGYKCKHIYAVEFTIKREVHQDGTVTETKSVTVTEKVTYKQDWPAYNTAQANEKDRFQVLLNDLCCGLGERDHSHIRGRKPHPVKDTVFASVFKVYSTFSSRRFSCDLRDAHAKRFTASVIPGLKVPQFLEDATLMPILMNLIIKSAAPLKSVETQFAVDASGFSGSRFDRWFDHKYGTPKREAVWVKCHIACGVKTNVVTAVRVLDSASHDSTQFGTLVKETAKQFTIREISADKAYLSAESFETVAALGGTAYIPFKTNSVAKAGGLYEKMFHLFQFNREEYMAHYHKRSNVESTFSAIKRKFGDSVRSKTDVAMTNEVLCKIVAHNICCLIQEQEELGIDTNLLRNSLSCHALPCHIGNA